jgi:hypothetical protein
LLFGGDLHRGVLELVVEEDHAVVRTLGELRHDELGDGSHLVEVQAVEQSGEVRREAQC